MQVKYALWITSLLVASNAAAQAKIARVADLESGIGLQTSHSRWFFEYSQDDLDSGVVFKRNSVAVAPYYKIGSTPLVVGLPIEYAIHKHTWSSSSEPEERIERFYYTPTIAYRLGAASLGLGYQRIQERGQWDGAADRTPDYTLAAWRTHAGVALDLGGGQVGLGFANRVRVQEEVTDKVSTPTSESSASSDVDLFHAPRATLYGRLPLSSAHSLIGSIDHTYLTSGDQDYYIPGKNDRGFEDSLGVNAGLSSKLCEQVTLGSELVYEGPARFDFMEGTGVTRAVGGKVHWTVVPIKNLTFDGTIGYVQGRDRVALEENVYDEDDNIVGTKTTKLGLRSSRADYGLGINYLF